MYKKSPPPGVRNNNPLNILRSKSKWLGLNEKENTGKFCVFNSVFFGWRAALIIMDITYRKRGWITIKKMIEHWAPYTENPTKSYYSFVGQYTGCPVNDTLPTVAMSPALWHRIMVAMARIEVGYIWVSQDWSDSLEDAIIDHVKSKYNIEITKEVFKLGKNGK